MKPIDLVNDKKKKKKIDMKICDKNVQSFFKS